MPSTRTRRASNARYYIERWLASGAQVAPARFFVAICHNLSPGDGVISRAATIACDACAARFIIRAIASQEGKRRAMRRAPSLLAIAAGTAGAFVLAASPLGAADREPPSCAAITFRPVPSGLADGAQNAGLYKSRFGRIEVVATV